MGHAAAPADERSDALAMGVEDMEAEAEAVAIVFGAKQLLNARWGAGAGLSESEGWRRALDLGRQALRLTKGSSACCATARAHEVIAVALLKLRYAARPSLPTSSEAGARSAQDWVGEVRALLHHSHPHSAAQDAAESYNEALQHVREARRLEPMDTRLLEREALVLASAGEYKKAEELLTAPPAWGAGPLSIEGVAVLALVRSVTCSAEAAVELTEALVDSAPHELWVLMLLGRLHLSCQHFHAALAAFFRVICASAASAASASSVPPAGTSGSDRISADWAADGRAPGSRESAHARPAGGCVWEEGDATSSKSLKAVVLVASQWLSHVSSAAALGCARDDVAVSAWLACVDVYLAAGLVVT